MTSRAHGLTRRLRAALRGPDAVRRADLRARQKAFRPRAPRPALPELRAAVAADPRLLAGLAWEWSQQQLTRENWTAVLTPDNVHLVLLQAPLDGWEPALERCAELKLPVFVWVTGEADPAAAAPWIEQARRVFVDDDRRVTAWQACWPEAVVDVLRPAAQPQLHSPLVGGSVRQRDAAAAVSFVVDGIDAGKQDVWDATPPAGPVVSGYRVVVEPAPWAAVAAAAGGSSLVVGPSAAEDLPADLRLLTAAAEDGDALRAQVTARMWQPELVDREGLLLGRAVRARHSFANRVDVLARAAGLRVDRPSRTVSAIVPSNREHELDNVFANVARQAHDGVQLVLVLHGLSCTRQDVTARAKAAGINDVTVVEADRSLPLGACMNLGLDAAEGAFVAKMDDDNFYGTHYLTDLVAAFDYTDAGIVGKWAHYVWLRSTGAVILRSARSEHRYERLVQGGSMVLRADVARALRFDDSLPRAVDTDILDRAKRDGVLTYSADRFNYVSVRGADRQAHTWTITDAALMNRAGELVFYGDPREHVDV